MSLSEGWSRRVVAGCILCELRTEVRRPVDAIERGRRRFSVLNRFLAELPRDAQNRLPVMSIRIATLQKQRVDVHTASALTIQE